MSFLLFGRRPLVGAPLLGVAVKTRGWLALLAGALLLTNSVFGQTAPTAAPKYGKVEASELSAAPFAADSGAAAVVLADVGRAYFTVRDDRFQVFFERVRRVKILDERGFDYATVRIPLYRTNGQEERVLSLKGATYALTAGKMTKTELRAADAVTEQRDVHRAERRFTLPAVRAGSVIEYAYTVQSDFLFNLQDWWFQEEIPVRWSEYRVQIPQYLSYQHLLTGYVRPQVATQEAGTAVMSFHHAVNQVDLINSHRTSAAPTNTETVPVQNYHWVATNVPAFRDDPYLTTPADYLGHVQFQLSGTTMPGSGYRAYGDTWAAATRLLLTTEEFGGYLGSVGSLTQPLRELRTTYADPAARAAAVVALVRRHVIFDGSDRLYATRPVRKVLEQQCGNCAEINLLLVSALREADLPAQPLILSTRAHGRVHDDLPLLDRYNAVLAALTLPDKPLLLLDATDPLAPVSQVPVRCLGTRGRLIAAEEIQQQWVAVVTPHSYTHYVASTVALQPDGRVTGTVRHEYSGYAGQLARYALAKNGAADFTTTYAHLPPTVRLVRHEIGETDNPTKPLTLTLTMEVPADEAAADANGTRYFSLAHLLQPGAGPLSAPTRRLPLDLGAGLNETTRLTLTLPDGYAVESLPTPVNLTLPGDAGTYQFVCSAGANGRSVDVLSRLVLRNASYEPTDYPHLRQLYEQLLTKHAELLTLKRKS